MQGIENQPPTDEQVTKIRKGLQDYISENGKDDFEEADINRVMTEDSYVHRWFMHMYGGKGDQLEECIKYLISALKWRKDRKIREITADKLNPMLKQKGSLYMKNKDKDGCPMLVFAMAKHVKGECPEDMKQLFLYYLERIDRETNGGKFSLVYECVGCGITNMDMDLIQFMIKCLEEYFPNNLNYILVIDMSWLLTAAWKIIKAWLPAGAVKKIKFVNKNTVDEFVPYDQKFVHWGGEDDWVYEFVEEKQQTSTQENPETN